MQEEVDPRIRAIWELHLAMEIEHLRIAVEMTKLREKRDPTEMLPPALPQPLTFHENKQWVRTILDDQVGLTGYDSEFVPVDQLPRDHRYFAYQAAVNAGEVPSEEVIRMRRDENGGEDYRFTPDGPHPIESMRDSASDAPGYASPVENHARAYAN